LFFASQYLFGVGVVEVKGDLEHKQVLGSVIPHRQLRFARDELDANRVDTARVAVGVFRAFGGGWDPTDNEGQL
jgi:hypothetical protein